MDVVVGAVVVSLNTYLVLTSYLEILKSNFRFTMWFIYKHNYP